MLYSKNGSLPMPQTDGTEGWIEVPDAPVAGEGQEVIWWYPPGWVIRNLKPEDRDGYAWSWSQSETRWIEYALPGTVVEVQPVMLTSDDISALTTEQISNLSGE